MGIYIAISFSSGKYSWICNRNIRIYKHIYSSIERIYCYWFIKSQNIDTQKVDLKKEFDIENSKKEIKSFCISYSVNYEELIADLYENRKDMIESLKMLRYVINFHKKGDCKGIIL